MLAVFFATFQVSAMTVQQSRDEAWFLTDKMAHELRLTNYQWDDVYEVNYDFFRALGHVTINYSNAERVREQKLMYILTVAQWNEYRRLHYFTAPVTVVNGNWSFSIYTRYDRNRFFDRNHNVVHTYNGGHSNNWSSYYTNRHNGSAGHSGMTFTWTGGSSSHNNNHNNSGSGNNYNNGHSSNGNGNNYNNGHTNNGNGNKGNNGNRGTTPTRVASTNGSNSNSSNSHVAMNTGRTPSTGGTSTSSRVAQSSRH